MNFPGWAQRWIFFIVVAFIVVVYVASNTLLKTSH
jgi:hypothetical protein